MSTYFLFKIIKNLYFQMVSIYLTMYTHKLRSWKLTPIKWSNKTWEKETRTVTSSRMLT